MVGRVLRPSPGKTDALILDHAGATFRHGFVEDPVIWSLDPDTKAETPAHVARGLAATSKLLTCSRCSAVRLAGKPCPECGFLPKRPGEYLRVREGELAHLDRNGSHPDVISPLRRQEWHAMLAAIAEERGYKPRWAAVNFKEKFGTWPPRVPVKPMRPDLEVSSWVRHKMIAFAKSRQKAAANG